MFFTHKYGTKKVLIGVHHPYPFQCPECKQFDTIEIFIFGDYYHFWYIPIFPYEKDGRAECSNCNFTIHSVKFNRQTKELFKEIKKKYRYPLYTYIGAAVLSLPIVGGILASIF